MLNHADLWSLTKALFPGHNIVTSLLDVVYDFLYEFWKINTGQHHTGAKKAVRSQVSIMGYSQIWTFKPKLFLHDLVFIHHHNVKIWKMKIQIQLFKYAINVVNRCDIWHAYTCISLYSKTCLNRPPMGQLKVALIKRWPLYTGACN